MKRRKVLGLLLLSPFLKYAKKSETILDRYLKQHPKYIGKKIMETGFWYAPYIPLTIRNVI